MSANLYLGEPDPTANLRTTLWTDVGVGIPYNIKTEILMNWSDFLKTYDAGNDRIEVHCHLNGKMYAPWEYMIRGLSWEALLIAIAERIDILLTIELDQLLIKRHAIGLVVLNVR